jgi:signal transduction histidine kinase
MAANNGYRVLTIVGVLALAGMATAQTRLSLQEAGSRKRDTYAPAYEGQQIEVLGTAASYAVRLREYSHLVIEDGDGHGLTLDGPEATLTGIRPGDRLDVVGTMFNRAGVPVLQPTEIRKLGSIAPPAPLKVGVEELNSSSHVGMLVETESYVITAGQNSMGEVLVIGEGHESPLRVFLPQSEGQRADMSRLTPGDKVRVVGISSQYCPTPPHNRYYQLIIGDPSAVTMVHRGWIVSPSSLAIALLSLSMALGIWSSRERAMRSQRVRLRAINALAEDVISAETPGEISRKLVQVLTSKLKVNDVNLYLLNRSNNALDRVPSSNHPEPLSISIDSPLGPLSAAVALCYRNRSLLHIPDTRKSPVVDRNEEKLPKSVLLVPMFAQQDLLGILALMYDKRGTKLNADDVAAFQHLSNQVATSLKLQEQASMRDQLLRSEKMAAAGQLITGVANELRGPLSAIHTLADELMATRPAGVTETGLREIAFEAHRGGEIVRRLVSFAKVEQSEARPLDISAILNGLMEFREREWTAKGVQVRHVLPRQAVMVMGDRSQLEQVLLNLLVHAEHSLTGAPEKCISIGSKLTEKQICITIDYSDRSGDSGTDPFQSSSNGDALGLQVCQGIVQGHGGEIRLIRNLPTGSRFELDLPQLQQAQAVAAEETPYARPSRPLTVLMVEPDIPARRKLLAILSDRGHRAIPAATAEDAVDMAHRLHFDIVFSSIRLPGMNWVEFFEKIRREIGSFVLVAEGYDADVSRAFKGSDGYLLSKPIEESDAQRLLATIESRQESLTRT